MRFAYWRPTECALRGFASARLSIRLLAAFIEKMQALVDKKPSLTEIPRAQRRAAKRVLAEFAGAHERNEAIALAYLSGRHTMAAIAAHFDAHYTTVSRLVKAYEADQKCSM